MNRKIGGSIPPGSLGIVSYFVLDCVLVQSWIRRKFRLSKDLSEVFRFCCLSVIE